MDKIEEIREREGENLVESLPLSYYLSEYSDMYIAAPEQYSLENDLWLEDPEGSQPTS